MWRKDVHKDGPEKASKNLKTWMQKTARSAIPIPLLPKNVPFIRVIFLCGFPVSHPTRHHPFSISGKRDYDHYLADPSFRVSFNQHALA